ncbi:MAG: response regulator transcription factor [Actinomycetota bacterium]|nr:response regulator transcription factor [Actinomycetota bacterium]
MSARTDAEPHVLVVDDDEDVRTSLERALRVSGFSVRSAADGISALRAVAELPPDCVVLDINMPGMDGVAVVTALRALGHDVPVCVLSARDTVDDRVAGLEAGADDYLVKPFALDELIARLRALLRRSPPARTSDTMLTVGPLRIDTARRQVTVHEREIELTKREYELLLVLAENATIVLSRQRLLELVWGYDFAVDTNVVDVFVGYVRRKLEVDGAPRLLHTVRGVGFVLKR